MFDPTPEILTKLHAESGLSISEGMPDFFINGDSEQMDWTTNKAIGWFDVMENNPEHIIRTQTTLGMALAEKISRIIIAFTFYSSNGSDAMEYAEKINKDMFELGYFRTFLNSGKEALGQTQTFNRVMMRFQKRVDLHA